jgi:hypothetical protein
MPLVLKDRVKETSTTTGTGTLTLGGAASGFQSFSVIGDGNSTYYAIVDSTAGAWEVGVGTYGSAGATLTRDVVLESSNSGSLVDFAAGSKDVFCTYPAEQAVTLDDVQTLTNKTISGASNTITNVSLATGVTGTLPVANGGTGAATLTANNVLLGNGTSALQVVAPGTSGNVLTSNGTTWTSATPVAPTPTIASTAEAEAGTNNTNFITPLRMREGFNASGSAPVYACRAWVNFDGSVATPSIFASGNVSSVSKIATGRYTVNFTTAMPDANYAGAGSALGQSNVSRSLNIAYHSDDSTKTASACSFRFVRPAGDLHDVDNASFFVIR